MKRLATVACVAALLLAGCGNSDEGQTELTQYLPEQTEVLSVVDLDAVREELELPDDADVADIESFADGDFDVESAEYQLFNAATNVVAPLRMYAQLLEAPPVLEALDGSAISAGAADRIAPIGAASVIQTSQSFDDFAAELEGAGYEREGDVLSNPDEAISEIVDAGDGIWVLSGDSDGPSASELAESPPGGPQTLVDLAGDSFPIVLAASVVEGANDCLVAFAGRQNAAGTEGEIVFEADGEASADAVDVAPLEDADIDPGEPSTDGSVVTIPFTAEPEPNSSPIGNLFAQFGPFQAYDCD